MLCGSKSQDLGKGFYCIADRGDWRQALLLARYVLFAYQALTRDLLKFETSTLLFSGQRKQPWYVPYCSRSHAIRRVETCHDCYKNDE